MIDRVAARHRIPVEVCQHRPAQNLRGVQGGRGGQGHLDRVEKFQELLVFVPDPFLDVEWDGGSPPLFC